VMFRLETIEGLRPGLQKRIEDSRGILTAESLEACKVTIGELIICILWGEMCCWKRLWKCKEMNFFGGWIAGKPGTSFEENWQFTPCCGRGCKCLVHYMHKHIYVVNIPNRTISILSRVRAEAVQLTTSVSHSLNRVVTFTKANSNLRLVQTAKADVDGE